MAEESRLKQGYYFQLYRQVSLGGKKETAPGVQEDVQMFVARQYLPLNKEETSLSIFLDKDGELVDLNAEFDPTGEWIPRLMFAGQVPEGMEYNAWEQYCRYAMYLFYNLPGVEAAFKALPYTRHYFDANDHEVDEAEAIAA